MSDWHDIKGDNPALHGRLLLLLTQPEKFDGAQTDVYDVTVGYWHTEKRKFVPAFNPATGQSSQTVRAFKWAELPDHSFVKLRSQVHI
jgi:hypothetical protein